VGKYTKLLCSKIYEDICPPAISADGSSQTEPVILQSTNCKVSDVYSHIDDLRSGQELNRVAIQSLSHSVDHLTETISQFRKEIDNNQQYNKPNCSHVPLIEIPEASESEVNEAFNDPSEAGESTKVLGNESLFTLEFSKSISDDNGDELGCQPGRLMTPAKRGNCLNH
jgi:hypothetical protein